MSIVGRAPSEGAVSPRTLQLARRLNGATNAIIFDDEACARVLVSPQLAWSMRYLSRGCARRSAYRRVKRILKKTTQSILPRDEHDLRQCHADLWGETNLPQHIFTPQGKIKAVVITKKEFDLFTHMLTITSTALAEDYYRASHRRARKLREASGKPPLTSSGTAVAAR